MSANFDFAQLSDQWFDLNGPMKMLHRMNDARIKFVRRYIDKKSQGLDIGSGAGIFPIAFVQQGFQCHALEQREQLVRSGKQQCLELQVDMQWFNDDLLSFDSSEQYDFVTCFEVIEHVEQREQFIAKLLSLVKPGGYIFFSTLNRTLASYLTTVIGAEYLLKLLPIGTHDYKLFLKPDELSDILNGAHLIDLQGLIYNPFTQLFFIGQSTQANYIGVWQKES